MVCIFLFGMQDVFHQSNAHFIYIVRSGGETRMSENNGITADEHDKKESAAVPVQIATMLKVVMLYDKFEKIFYRWSTHCRDDRDVLVLCMKPSSIVDTHLIYTLCMMYPFRIHGPILVNETMQIEFLNDVGRVPLLISSLDGVCLNAQFAISKQQKRKRDETDHQNKDIRICVEEMKSKIIDAISKTNTSRIHVQSTVSGMDSKGPWVSFELSACDRLNLDFLGKFQLSVNNSSIKVQNCSSPQNISEKVDLYLLTMCNAYRGSMSRSAKTTLSSYECITSQTDELFPSMNSSLYIRTWIYLLRLQRCGRFDRNLCCFVKGI